MCHGLGLDVSFAMANLWPSPTTHIHRCTPAFRQDTGISDRTSIRGKMYWPGSASTLPNMLFIVSLSALARITAHSSLETSGGIRRGVPVPKALPFGSAPYHKTHNFPTCRQYSTDTFRRELSPRRIASSAGHRGHFGIGQSMRARPPLCAGETRCSPKPVLDITHMRAGAIF